MTRWSIIHGDLLAVPADGLICSANPDLNLSGGVGGAFLIQYGPQMQDYLHAYLRDRHVRTVPQGTVVLAPPCGSPYQFVAHAVAINVFYETSAEQIAATYRTALRLLADAGCKTVAAACLGCGYGRCTPENFARAITLVRTESPGVEAVTLVTTNRDLVEYVNEHTLAGSDGE